MRVGPSTFFAAVAVSASLVVAQESEGPLAEVPETIYGPPPLQTPGTGFNDGAVGFAASAIYSTDYVFRGLEIVEAVTNEDAANLGITAELAFDLGRLPDPFVRVRTNTAGGDDVSNFQVIRPTVGFSWETDLFEFVVAHQSFTYPDRNELDSAEIFVELDVNDAALGDGEGKLFGPYVFAAYDYDSFEGTYVEFGARRNERIGESSLSLGYEGHVAYVDNLEGLFGGSGSGFQHYQFGLLAAYELNTLLNISRRYGKWTLGGQVYYTDGIDNDLAADTQIWGGGGISFAY
ncbi:MAG: hypothetical protein AAGI46_01615 [Planctomycetota bacterium]